MVGKPKNWLERDEEVTPNGLGTTIFPYLSGLFLSEKYSDLIICCRGKEFKAHRAIVCPQSSVLDAAVENSSLFTDNNTTIVTLNYDDPDMVQRLLELWYTGTYHDGTIARQQLVATRQLENAWTSSEEILQGHGCGLGEKKDGEAVVISDYDDNTNEDVEHEEEEEEDEEKDEDEGDEADNEADNDDHNDTDKDSYRSNLDSSEADSDLDDDEDMADSDIAKELKSSIEVKHPPRGGCDVLFGHLRVYLLADKYNVEPLRKLARHRFKMEAEIVYHNAPEWPLVVDELISACRGDDNDIRSIAVLLTSSMMFWDVDFDRRMKPVMLKHGAFTLDVMYRLHLASRLDT
ncbi:hypothetical protein QBC34DRAFT_408651 [Podospora aff. communis PSN243]|uniref:BTB domain-containing protein n=1 Tax=Podospora aff. communis PSN243 TaxID=3040156 RepID=A0AAV9GGU0_9PEZI|nr:hypothetical protein QBC34DRAFT_408651 [Podospora aff. communis PSN243]